MSEKYYVCSETELLRLANSVWNATVMAECESEISACRARPFEKYQAVVEAAKETIESFNGDGPIKLNHLEQALTGLEEDV